MSLNVGDIAPDFTLPSTIGKNFTLSEIIKESQKSIVLFFILVTSAHFAPGRPVDSVMNLNPSET